MIQNRSTRLARSSRLGAILVCVMVVLLIVSLFCVQTMQTLMIIRRSDSSRRNLRQARELIELGRIAHKQALAQDATTDDTELSIALGDSQIGEITVSASDSGGKQQPGTTRIVVRYPANSAGEVTASWEGE